MSPAARPSPTVTSTRPVPQLTQLMTNALTLLKDGGRFEIEVPYEHAATAWQDPTHVRALNENSWIYYCEWFWYLGWFEHRFEMIGSSYLDLKLQPCGKENAAFMRVAGKWNWWAPRPLAKLHSRLGISEGG